MSDREKAIARFVREHGAQSHHVRENGDLILTRGKGKKIQQLMVTASALSIVEERIRTNVPPYRYEMQAKPLGGARKSYKSGKRNFEKRSR